MIDGKNLFDQPIKNDLETYDNVQNIMIGQRDDYTTCYLQGYPYFKENYKLIGIEFSKQQALDGVIQKLYNKLMLLEI